MKRIWYKSYPQGIVHDINLEKYSSIPDLLDESFKKYGDMAAYVNMGKCLSFNEVNMLSSQFASFLQNELKLEKGSRIGIQMPNLLQFPIVLFGAIKAGIIVVNTNPLYTPSEMEHQFKDSGVEAVVILANFANNLEKIISNTNIKHVIITEIGDMQGGLKKMLINFIVKHVKKMIPTYSLKNAYKFNQSLAIGKQKPYTKREIKSEDIAFLQYTGGTTGVPKGAMLTHKNMVCNMEQISAYMIPKLKEYKETMITALPLYHIFSLTVNCLFMLKIGAKNILITNPRDMKAFCKDLAKYKFSIFTGVNTLFNSLLNQENFRKLDFSSLKVTVGGGMAVQNTVARQWEELTGEPLVEGYGVTETSPVLCCNPIDNSERIGTIGLPLPSTDIKFIDDNGDEVPIGEKGELCAKGPQVMKGYWNNEAETRDSFIDSQWFKTGDIGYVDEDGFMRIVDRKKEMINVSGFNVYPNEVENVIASHPKVLEVGVIGVSDKQSSEVVKACIVKKDPSLAKKEVIEHCKQSLAGYKIPKIVEFRKDLPKSNIGKILRRKLK